jgi:hypothetical protein
LNFALAIGQVLDGSEEAGDIEARSNYRIMVMKASDSVSLNAKITLPKTLDEFYASLRQTTANWTAKIHSDFMKNHADAIFPKGNSEELLIAVWPDAFPKLISQSESGTWERVGDAPRKVQLDKGGYLQEGITNHVFFVRLRAPDDVNTADLIADSKKFMDLLLRGYPVSRPVGTDTVRVTSMGKASVESWFTDDYRRKWQIRSWLLPFNDSAITTIALPTPDGLVMMMAQAPTPLRDSLTKEMEALCGFFYVSYTGTLAQWQAFLANPSALPATLSNVKIQFDYNRGLAITSSRFQFLVPVGVLKIDADSVLMLKYSYLRDGPSNVVWDLGGVALEDSALKRKWIGLVRRPKPPPSLPDVWVRSWRTMSTGAPTWDGVPFLKEGRTEIDAMVNVKDLAAGKTNVGYALTLNSESGQLAKNMKNEFSALLRGFTTNE